jgi:hypothetical protein
MYHWIAWLALAAAPSAMAAPHVPADDATVLERLPIRPGDPVAAELRGLRAATAAAPSNPAAATRLGRRYFELAMAQGDARYIGYAEGTLRRWYGMPKPPAEVLTLRGLLRQYRHDFHGALDDLEAAARMDPDDPEPHAWRAAIFMVLADYPAARRECELLRELSGELHATGCIAHIDATTGRGRAAYDALAASLARNPRVSADLRLWVLTRLAEISARLEDAPAAERHYRDALALRIADNYLYAAYADFLLEQDRPAEVVALLKDWTRSDTLLLRLALAQQRLRDASAAQLTRVLGERFAEAAQRGERLHLQEEARYLLELKQDARAALAAAAENWKSQREPRDAGVLLESALAARDPQAAQPALEWLASSGFEGRKIRGLAASLKALAR